MAAAPRVDGEDVARMWRGSTREVLLQTRESCLYTNDFGPPGEDVPAHQLGGAADFGQPARILPRRGGGEQARGPDRLRAS